MKSHSTHIALAALAASFALPLAAQAQTGREPGNVVVGGIASMFGGGDDIQIAYSAGGGGGGGGVLSQSGRPARFTGGHGDGSEVEYLAPAAADPGREARLVGGGDDAEVVYTDH